MHIWLIWVHVNSAKIGTTKWHGRGYKSFKNQTGLEYLISFELFLWWTISKWLTGISWFSFDPLRKWPAMCVNIKQREN